MLFCALPPPLSFSPSISHTYSLPQCGEQWMHIFVPSSLEWTIHKHSHLYTHTHYYLHGNKTKNICSSTTTTTINSNNNNNSIKTKNNWINEGNKTIWKCLYKRRRQAIFVVCLWCALIYICIFLYSLYYNRSLRSTRNRRIHRWFRFVFVVIAAVTAAFVFFPPFVSFTLLSCFFFILNVNEKRRKNRTDTKCMMQLRVCVKGSEEKTLISVARIDYDRKRMKDFNGKSISFFCRASHSPASSSARSLLFFFCIESFFPMAVCFGCCRCWRCSACGMPINWYRGAPGYLFGWKQHIQPHNENYICNW